eukprot:CAMPEP_0119499914 /NCGR_PEP_ID=MMETSP1344-20130328/22225_1 /TAXON_ID=236787 /ORGANISM="Florenciella parvula, Strain CCMP2471" /LENGTH=33 /DNA_ID= /DNA_START= /DNA_END= /DNA_ORIENTATION=
MTSLAASDRVRELVKQSVGYLLPARIWVPKEYS